jgi:hypothetical protein
MIKHLIQKHFEEILLASVYILLGLVIGLVTIAIHK